MTDTTKQSGTTESAPAAPLTAASKEAQAKADAARKANPDLYIPEPYKTDDQSTKDAKNNAFPEIAQAGADAREAIEDIKDSAGNVLQSAAEVAKDPGKTTKKIGDSFKNFKLNPGSIIGGLLGGGVAFLAGSVFGSGPLKLVFMGLLMPLLAYLGATNFGPTIQNWLSGFGGKKNADGGVAQAQTPGQAQAQAAEIDARTDALLAAAQSPNHIPAEVIQRGDVQEMRAYLGSRVSMGSVLPDQQLNPAEQVYYSGRNQQPNSRYNYSACDTASYEAMPEHRDRRQESWGQGPSARRF